MSASKPHLSLRQLLSMNLGFFGIQYSFGLQQANMSPIYQFLGADERSLPLLWLAGPVTGLLVQPLVGALSDRTDSRWGRRTPYALVGAVLCSLGLLAMPMSPTLWFAAGLLWFLDAANNLTMQPLRAYVSDRLAQRQQAAGYLVQGAFTGLAQTLAYLTPSLFVWWGLDRDAVGGNGVPLATVAAFVIGALMSVGTMVWSVRSTPELPLSEAERTRLRARPRGLMATLREIAEAARDMPPAMRRLWWMKLFQWYGMLCYWIYIVPALARAMFGAAPDAAAGLREAGLLNGQIGGFYNFVAFVSAFAMIPLSRRFGPARVHALCLALAGLGMCSLPGIHDTAWLFVPMVGVGLAWASMMGNPYAMLADSVPPERVGVYMGLFNAFIVLPMLLQMLTMPLYYDSLLGADPRRAVQLAGVLLIVAAGLALRLHQHQHRHRQG
ncbi:MAG: MFS transporter [Proteobacteria bacterium]|uniref:MFS transporter n=1 Tax=Aquabacterium sp. TaxID=1872578 RepID=UPI0035C69247|nr:MFS transporter [Pseudomonadota bacterium]